MMNKSAVKVVDVDMNLNPEAIDQIPIQLFLILMLVELL